MPWAAPESYPELVGLDPAAVAEALLSRATLPTDPAELVRRLLAAAARLGASDPLEPDGAPADQA